MASFLSSSTLTFHLSDRALTPILSTSRTSSRRYSQTQAQALSSLTTTATSAFDAASRLGLGTPQRIMIESSASGPILLHSYLNPPSRRRPHSRRTTSNGSAREIIQQAQDDMRPLTATTDPEGGHTAGDDAAALVNGVVHGDDPASSEPEEEEEDNSVSPPLLIATVVAPAAADVREARRAAAQLERTGREFQRQWTREQEDAQQSSITADTEVEDG